MKWEILITTQNPNVVDAIIHQNISAITHNDIDYFSVKPIDEED